MSAITANASSRVRPTLSAPFAFAGTSIAFAALYLAAGAPTPLFVLLEGQWGFAPALLTLAFASYAIGLLASLLVAGGLSDYIGRRPVLIGSLAVEIVAMVVFVFAPNIGWIIAARVIQGIATGAASSAFTATIIELAPASRKKLASIIGGSAPTAGLGLGALVSGFAVQFSAAPAVIVFTALAVVMTLGLLVAVFSTETVSRQSGALRSLVPRVSIPGPARREFASAIPGLLGSWMLAALFLGLVPSIIRVVFHIDSGVLNGVTAFIEPAAAAIAGFVLGGVAVRRTTIIGATTVLVGSLMIVAGLATSVLPLVMLGGVVGGVGFGAIFSGTLRAVAPLALPHQRSALFAAVFIVAYLSFGVPAIVLGQLVAPFGLLPTSIGFGLVIAAAAAVSLGAQLRAVRSDR